MITDLTYQQSVFKDYHNGKHFSEFYLQDGGKSNWHRYEIKLRHCHPTYIPAITPLSGAYAFYCICL